MSTYHQHSSTSSSSSLSSSSAPLPTSSASSASSASSLPETVKGVIPSRLQAAFGVTVPSTSRFYDTQDTKTMFGFHTEVTAEYKYPKIIHEHQPYQGWTREIIVDDEGNSKVQFIPPEKLAVEVISDSNSSNSTSSSSSVVSSREIIRSAEELTKYIRSTKVLESCPTLVESSFEFEDLFCVCHRPDEGDYFNCDYGLAGCGSWFHSDCTGVSKGSVNKLLPGRDVPLVCPLCTAYLETNLEEDKKFSIDSQSGEERLLYRLRMGGFYYITKGPLSKFNKTTSMLPQTLYVNMIPKCQGRIVPYYRNIGGLDFIQSRHRPKYWGLSKLRAPVKTEGSNNKHSYQHSSKALLHGSKMITENRSKWVANCSKCNKEGPYNKPEQVAPSSDDGKGGTRASRFELHLILRAGKAGMSAVSDVCGVFKVNPRIIVSEGSVSSNSQSVGSGSGSGSCTTAINNLYAQGGRITKKVSRKEQNLQQRPSLLHHHKPPPRPADGVTSHSTSSTMLPIPPSATKHSSNPYGISLVTYDDRYDSSRQFDPLFIERSKLQNRLLLVQKYNEERFYRQKLLFREASSKRDMSDPNSLLNSNQRIMSIMNPHGSITQSGELLATLSPPRTHSSPGLGSINNAGVPCFIDGSGVSRSMGEVRAGGDGSTSSSGQNPATGLSRSSQLPARAHYPSTTSGSIAAHNSIIPLLPPPPTIPFNGSEVGSQPLPTLPTLVNSTARHIHRVDDSMIATSLSVAPSTETADTAECKSGDPPESETVTTSTADNDSLNNGDNREERLNAPASESENTDVTVVTVRITNNAEQIVDNKVCNTTASEEKRSVEDNINEMSKTCDNSNIDVVPSSEIVGPTATMNDSTAIENISDSSTSNLSRNVDEKSDSLVHEDRRSGEDVIESEGDDISEVKNNEDVDDDKLNSDQARFITSVDNSIFNSSEQQYEQSNDDDSENEDDGRMEIVEDAEFLKRKRKAISNAKSREYMLKKRLLENEASRIASCFRHAANSSKVEADFLFVHLPLEDGGIRSCGFNVSSGAPSSIQNFLTENNACGYCIEPITNSEDHTIFRLGDVPCNFHKSCAHFLHVNALNRFISARNYTQFITAGGIVQYSSDGRHAVCGLCDKSGGALQSLTISNECWKSNESKPRSFFGHPVCVASLIESKQLERKFRITSPNEVSTEDSSSGDENLDSDMCMFDRNMDSGYCVVCGSHRGLVTSCSSPLCSVQVHHMCARREKWNLEQNVVTGENQNDATNNADGSRACAVFLCPLHSLA